MPNAGFALIAFILGAAATGVAGFYYLRMRLRRADEKQRASERARQLEAELALATKRQEAETALAARESALSARERELQAAERRQLAAESRLEERRSSIDERLREIESSQEEARKLAADYRQRLQSVNGVREADVKEHLLEEVRRECEDETRQLRGDILQRTSKEIEAEARRILIDAMQRISSVPQHDINATIVTLPSEDMKGRIIGREGRNIKSFESLTGTTLLIDETPNSVLISSFEPLRREIARSALERLMKDGRIHPSSIEEAVQAAESEIQQSVIEFGEEALRRTRVTRVHPEIVSLLGKLRFRLSNNQNSLDHSVEVANLCALLAAELQLDPEPAKRAGLLHDIGKSLSEEYSGSHAVAGAQVLKRHGEDPRVINAVAAHHEEVDAESPYAPLVIIADTLSAVRPGARAESIDSYVQRVKALENLARDFKGVHDAYAIQAGREIRVIVEPNALSEDDTRLMARNLRRRIENELQYPGTIKITVVRERRFVEQAK